MWPTIIGCVTALATAVLAILTGVYVVTTHRILRQTEAQASAAREQARATMETLRHLLVSSMPRWVYAAGIGSSPEQTGIRLRNDGASAGEAIDVSFRPPLPAQVTSVLTGEAAVRPVPPGGHLSISIQAPRSAGAKWEGVLTVKCLGIGGRSYLFELSLSVERASDGILRATIGGAGRSSYPDHESTG
jgi:hypothetical protein